MKRGGGEAGFPHAAFIPPQAANPGEAAEPSPFSCSVKERRLQPGAHEAVFAPALSRHSCGEQGKTRACPGPQFAAMSAEERLKDFQAVGAFWRGWYNFPHFCDRLYPAKQRIRI